ncbi:MAG TPA: hypothetical protein VIN56_10680 [Candidatus Dormibacteraeota bacterium]|jgi:hypothetical protein
MRLAIPGNRTELGRALARAATELGHDLADSGAVDAYVDVQHQVPNSLLHDGHAWKGYVDRAVGRTQRRLHEARSRGAGTYVYASYSFLRGVDQPERLKDPLRAIAHTSLAIEEMVLAAPGRSCVVRLGYLYGPSMNDLRKYRTAFRLGRPYWPGPRRAAQDNLHQVDAATALLAAAGTRSRGRLFYATDGRPVPFMEWMDHFARLVGNPLPLHMSGIFKLSAQLIIREEHMQLVKLPMPTDPPSPMVPGWKPRYPDYRIALDETIAEWKR